MVLWFVRVVLFPTTILYQRIEEAGTLEFNFKTDIFQTEFAKLDFCNKKSGNEKVRRVDGICY